ncbi:MAG: ABC transporter transmembrane domain-containing protein, partial [Anaerolineales bacterium]|nr:ABC transporter transmembrane domain-containing protein [Anaerolineales bacterium]
MFSALRRPARPADEKFIPPSRTQVLRLLRYLRPYVPQMTIALIALVISSALSLVFPWIMQNLVDAVFGRNDPAELNRITLILLAAFLANAVFRFIEGLALTYVGERIVVDLRRETYAHLHTLSVRFFADRRTGELLSRLASDVTV